MKYLSLFSGIGAFEKALKNQGIPFELVGYSEIDKYASKSYSVIHGVPESLNLGDITKIDEKALPKIDFITYGFPCQDISLAGKQKGLFNADGSKTRSGLFFDALRIIEATHPLVAIAENVKNITSKKFEKQFNIVLTSLEEAEYNNYYSCLNARDFGIPQNREREFIVSVRKDIDNGRFQFPKPIQLTCNIEDFLEDDAQVDEKFYLSEEKIQKITFSTFQQERSMIQDRGGCCSTLLGRDYKDPKCVQVANLNHYKNDQMNRVYSTEGIAPSLLTVSGGGRETKILVRQATKEGQIELKPGGIADLSFPSSSSSRRGRVQEGGSICPTLTTANTGICKIDVEPLRVRKLTPKEYFRLMGFDDEDFDKAAQVTSNTQLYKQAGNSIVVDVAEELLCMMLDEDGNFFV